MDYDILNNALITVGNGMVGTHVKFGFKPSSLEMDITDSNSIEIYIKKLSNISCIIHLAAINLRESEEKHSKAIDVIINGTTQMLNIAMKLNIPFILLSTGAVFSSENSNMRFDEMFKTCPNSMYGYAKSASEKIALLYSKTILIRTGWLFGGNQKTHYKFVENVINNLKTNTIINASNNFFGSPTYVFDLIEQMKYLILNLKYGIHHVVNSGFACGYDIALEIAQTMNVDNNKILSVDSSIVPNSGPPRSNTEKLESIHKFNILRSWNDSLKDYIDGLNNQITSSNTDSSLIEHNNNTQLIKTNNKKWSNRNICRLCNSYNLQIFFKLEPTPPANHFVSEPKHQDVIPLDICMCQDCKHIQLLQIVDPEYQYSTYLYVSSTSNTMTNHLKNNVLKFTDILNLTKTCNILEIGANDGVCIKQLLDNGFINVVGIDPASNINERHNLPIICDFFGSNVVEKLRQKYNNFKLIYAFHCCAHIENIQDVFQSIYALLDDDGTFIMEVGYFYEVFKKKLFDVIYHEHIDYHTTVAIQNFAKKNNLMLYKVEENDIQGGSIQFFFCKNNNSKNIDNSVLTTIQKENEFSLFDINNLLKWQISIINNGKDINYIVNSLISYGKTIVGYGASAKLTTFLYQYKLSNSTIKYIIDDSIYKQYLYSPGLHIPIKPFNILATDKVDYIIIFSWNFTNEIVKKLEDYRKIGIRIIIPFPEIMII